MPGEALLRLADEAPVIAAAIMLGAFVFFALAMRPLGEGGTKKVVIIDDDPSVRLALKRVIEGRTLFRVVGEAADGGDGAAVVDALLPDLVVIDVKLPSVDGLETTRRIHELHPEIKVVGFSAVEDDATGAIMRRAGASATLVKGASPDEIVETLLEIA